MFKKPSSTYKMKSLTKKMLAGIADSNKRNLWKNSMIQAELAAAVSPRREPRDNNSTTLS